VSDWHEKTLVTLYQASTSPGSPEHVIIDICVPATTADVEDLEYRFNLMLRQLRRHVADVQARQEAATKESDGAI